MTEMHALSDFKAVRKRNADSEGTEVLKDDQRYCEDCWSPGGAEVTLLAGLLGRLNDKATVLDVGCGSGAASVNLSLRFGCTCLAFDSEAEYVELARSNATRFGVDALVTVQHCRIEEFASQQRAYDMVVAEGGVSSYVGHASLLHFAHGVLRPGGVIAISDLVLREGISSGKYLLPFEIPEAIRKFYEPGVYASAKGQRVTEARLDELISGSGFERILSFELARSHWCRYRVNMDEHGRRGTGPALRDPAFARTAHHEECLWATEAQKYVAYYYSIARSISKERIL